MNNFLSLNSFLIYPKPETRKRDSWGGKKEGDKGIRENKGDKGKTQKKEPPLTRKQEREKKRLENQNKPKKNSIDLPNRKVDIEIVDVSDDEVKSTTPPGAPGHHGAHGHRENKTKSVSKDVKQGTHKPKATMSRFSKRTKRWRWTRPK